MVVPAAVAIALALWLFVDRLAGSQIREPLLWDEILSLENHSWVTFRSNGLPTHPHRADDLLNLQRPNGMQLVAGLYRAISVWRGPNDHVVNSVLLNLSTALWPGGEAAAVRLPAWAGALVFAAGLAWLAWRSGYRLAWPLALLVAASWPYVHLTSLQARGYSWMLALQVILMLLLAEALPRRASSIAWGALCGFVAILSFWNTINLVVDWLAPLYLGLWLVPPGSSEAAGSVWHELSAEDRRAYRQNLVVQCLVLGFFVLLFFIQFLPYVLISMQEYGIPAHGLDFFHRLVDDVLGVLFPNAVWALVGVAGVVGWYFMLRDTRVRHLGVVSILSGSISLAHFVVAQKLPYARTCGYFLPLVTLGATHVAELGLKRVADRRQAILAGAAVIGVSLLVMLQHATLRSTVSELVGYKQRLQHEFVNDRPYIITALDEQDWMRIRHVPPWYLTVFDGLDRIATATHLAFLITPTDPRSASWAGVASWPKITLPDRVLKFSPAVVRAVDELPPSRFPALIVWVLAPDREEIRNELLRTTFDGLHVERVIEHRNLLTKWEFVNQVYAVQILIKNPADYQEALEALRRGRHTLRGKALLIEPTGG